MISTHVQHRGHRSRFQGSQRSVLWSEPECSDSPHRCWLTPGLPPQTDSNPEVTREKRLFPQQDSRRFVTLLRHNTFIFLKWPLQPPGGALSAAPHLSFSPNLWTVNEDETSSTKAGPSVRAVEFPVCKNKITNLQLTCRVGCSVNDLKHFD